MEAEKLSPHMQKIVEAIAKVSDNLIAFKKSKDSPLWCAVTVR